jgi:hypothetical protein
MRARIVLITATEGNECSVPLAHGCERQGLPDTPQDLELNLYLWAHRVTVIIINTDSR